MAKDNWIKLGSRHFNLDHVSCVDEQPDGSAVVNFTNPAYPAATFTGDDAAALLAHVGGCCHDVTPKEKPAHKAAKAHEVGPAHKAEQHGTVGAV